MIRIPMLVPIMLFVLIAAIPACAAASFAYQVSAVSQDDEWYSAWNSQEDTTQTMLSESIDPLTFTSTSTAVSSVASETPASKKTWSGPMYTSHKSSFGGLPVGAALSALALAGLAAGGLGGGGGSAIVSPGGTGAAVIGSDRQQPLQELDSSSASEADSAAPVTDSSSLVLFGITALPFIISRFRPRR